MGQNADETCADRYHIGGWIITIVPFRLVRD